MTAWSKRVSHAKGFTIVELMATVAVLAILVSLGAPAMTDLVRDQRVKTATFDLYASLAFARSEAIKRNADVRLVIASGSNWAAGWSVQDASNAVLRAQDALGNMTISGVASPVTYQRDGRIAGVAGLTFVVQSAESATITARCVRVDLSGRPNIKVDTNKNPADGCQ